MPPTPKAAKQARRGDGRNTLSAQLRDLIARQRLSATALGRLADVDRRQLARWIAGEKDIVLGTADRIAAALGLRLAEGPARKSARPLPPADPRSVFEVARGVPAPTDEPPVDSE